MIDLIIPTLWKSDINLFLKYLNKYSNNTNVNKIIIIDNDLKNRPNSSILQHQKISLYRTHQNIFVNPSWNYGVYKASSDIICLLSDDVFVSDTILNYLPTLNFDEIDIIGCRVDEEDLNLEEISIDRNVNIGAQYYGFGCCMIMQRKKYLNIPSLYKIWYGDDYLAFNSKKVYRIGFDQKHVKFSQTIQQYPENSYIKKRIQTDINNARRFLFKKSLYK